MSNLLFPNQKSLPIPDEVAIAEDDIAADIEAWKRDPPDAYFTNILEAEPEERDAAETIPQFAFEKASQRYRDKTSGKFISAAAVRDLTKKRIRQVGDDISTIANLLVGNKISVPTWEQASREGIKQLFTQQYLLGIGGQKNMTQRDYGILGKQIKSQYEYLNGFANDLTTKGLSEEKFRYRLQLYANSSRQAFERARLEAHQRSAFNWERRIRTKVESCDPCIGYAAQGWVSIGSLPEPTQECDCKANCGCYKQFSKQTTKPADSLLHQQWGWVGGLRSALSMR